MSARARTPAIWLLAEAMIRRRPGSDDQKDGFLLSRFPTRSRVFVRAEEVSHVDHSSLSEA